PRARQQARPAAAPRVRPRALPRQPRRRPSGRAADPLQCADRRGHRRVGRLAARGGARTECGHVSALPEPETAALLPALGLSLLLGLRHAADPDHLTAVATLALGAPERGLAAAARLGLAWGLGHALTLVLLGLPVLLLQAELPEGLGTAAEVLVALVIVALALRLLRRWRRGELHVHAHAHGG